jgi:hypothetical protein
VNVTPLLTIVPTFTVTGPVTALAGTGTTILLGPQLVASAAAPPNEMAPCCVAPKLDPVTVTVVPIGPEEGDIALIEGGTVKDPPLLDTPPTVTTTWPVVAPDGTGTPMLEALQLEGTAVAPLNVTVLVP